MSNLQNLLLRPIFGRVVWVAFAIVFFYSGLYFTEWLLEPGKFAGGWRWLGVAAFPFLLPAFFVVNRRYGCASGACRVPSAGIDEKKGDRISVPPMPGA